jgi:PAS domain S-box-containing protein
VATTVSLVTVGSTIVRLVPCAAAIAWILALSRPGLADATIDGDVPAGQMRFRVFAGPEGLKNLVIASIAQDASGLLWLATDDGVYRFDGERFTHFARDSGLASTAISVMAIGADGAACAAGRGGLACWDGQRFSQAGTQGLPAEPITTMVSYGGKLWVGTEGGLYVQTVDSTYVPAPGWPGSHARLIRALWADAGGLVVGDGATVQLSTGNGEWHSIGDVGLGTDPVDAVLRDRQGALWIRTPSHLWLLPAGAARVVDITEGLPTRYDLVGVPNAMAIGPRGDVLVGTDVGIAYRERGRWRMIDPSTGMPQAAARSLLVDREGTIWIGGIGLVQLRGRGVVERYDVPSGLPGNIVWGYWRDVRGTLWVGTNRCLARAIDGRWECVRGTEGRVVRTIVFPPQGGVFAGGAPSDLLYIDPTGKITSLRDTDGIDDRVILSIAIGPEGDLWIATSGGMRRLPHALAGPMQRVDIPGVRAMARFAQITVVGAQLWTATDEGILVHEDGAWKLFNKQDGFLGSAMRRVIHRADGRMCTSYSEAIGVSCFRYHDGRIGEFEHLRPVDGLSSGMAYFLGEDRARRLWVGTGDGIDVVTPAGIDHFDESDGVAGNDSAASAYLVDGDGSLWLGSTGGATHVYAQSYDGPPPPPRTVFLDGRLGEQSIIHPAGALERRSREAQADHREREALETPHDHNALNVEFASASMLDPKRVEYQVRLSPLESEWSVTHQRQVRYPVLVPGSYRFEVRARVGAGLWGPTSGFSFAVLPAWWQTRWFLAACVLAGALAIAAGVTARQRTVLRRRTRQLHERSDASLRAVVDLMPDLISVHRGPKLIYLNRASRRMLGIEVASDRWDTVDLNERIHPDDRAANADLVRKIVAVEAQLVPHVIEIRLLAADGNWRICEVSAVLVEIAGEPTVVSSGRDVTERKRMRAKLLVSDRMASLGTLAAGIAHEINNPLAYVTGNLEVAAETLAEPAVAAVPACTELAAVIADARDGAERVRKIVHGLRSFSRAEEEKRVSLALPSVLEAAIRMTGNELRHRAVLARDFGATPPVVADDSRLTQVFINLLVNAAHAIPEGHTDANRITVRTRTDDQGRAIVEIEDTGRGMAPDVQARVFDPFFTTKDVGEGTGLGLSICHGIITGLGGQISLDSAPGKGTVVRVVLPADAAVPVDAGEVEAAPAPATNGGRRHRVMLVDDEPQVAQTIERLLRRDYDITVALCGKDAIDHIARGARFDAIVSDVMMPNMTGIELIEELQRLAPDQAQRLIFLSGGVFTAQTRERLDEIGAPQLEKPVTARELRAWVTRVAGETNLPAL